MSSTNSQHGEDRMIKVRDKDVIRLHWFNAFCWFALVLTGFGIISGDFVRLVPAFWPTFLQNLFGGNANLALVHAIGGIIWALVFVVYSIVNWQRITKPFLQQVISITPKSVLNDFWSMTITLAHLFGLMRNTPTPPVKGRYNGAQRLLGTMIIVCSVAIALSGFYLFAGPKLLDFASNPMYGAIFRAALAVHASSVLLVLIGLIAHIYFAVIEEREALESMKSGYAKASFLEHHSPAWYAELQKENKA